MTNKFLLILLGFNPDLTSRQPRVDTLSLVSRQSDLLTYLGRIAAILVLVLSLGIGNAWGKDETLTITGTSSGHNAPWGTSYGSKTGSASTSASTDISLSWTNVGRMNTGIQIKAGTSNCFYSTSCPTTNNKIKSINITNKTNSGVLYCSTDGENWSDKISYTSGKATDVSAFNYKYFKVTATSKYCVLTSIVVTYTAGCTGLEMSAVTATAGDRQIVLSWPAVANADSYTVTCKEKSSGDAAGTASAVTGTTTKSCTITGLTNGTEYTWSVMPVGSGNYCDSNTPATGDATPNVFRTITYYDKDGQHTTSLADGTNIATALTALYGGDDPVSCDATNYEYFVGWKVGEISGTASSVTLLDDEVVNSSSPSNNYYAVWSDTDPSSGSWEVATSIAAGDVVVLCNQACTYELNGISTTSTTYGVLASVENKTPANLYPLTIEAGDSDGTFSFKNGTKYLSWSSGNSLASSTTKDNNSSWTVSISKGVATIRNKSDNTRYLQYNAASRFACYTNTQADVALYKQGSSGTPVYITTCCTELGSINGSISWTNPTTAVLTWDNIDHVSSWAASCIVHGGSSAGSVGSITTNGAGQKICTVTGLSCNTNYDFTISATAASGYCDKSQTIENENSGTWSVTSTITNGTKTSVPTTACGDYTATFAASSGFHFPAKGDITVTGAKDFGWNSSTGELTISGANITGNISISFTCPADACTDAFSLHTGTKSGSDWLYNKCFSDADWGAVDDAIWSGEFPSTNECYVGWAGGNSYHGAYWAVGGIKTYDIPNGRTLGWNSENYYQDYPATAIGTFHIYKNSTDANYYLRFKPTSYVLRTGSDGTSWTSRDMTVSGVNAHYYESEFVTLTSTIISEHAYVDLKANNVNGHVWCNFSNDRVASGNVKVKNGASTFRATDLQAADNGTYGKFQIDITQDVDNWKLAFVPYYRITYNANGGTGSMTASSYVEVGSTASAAANGFTAPTGKQFGGWATSAGGEKVYDPNDNIVLTGNVELFAVWTDIDYTVTVNQSPAADATLIGGTTTAHYGGTINISTDEPSGYRFNGWTSSPSVTFADASATSTSFTMPDGNVTVTANFVQTHTVTWKVSGSADNEVVYDHGDALVLPSNPSAPTACSEKRFVGWKEGAIDGSTDDRPTMLNPSSPGTVTADKTYYAVFADEGTTFTKVTDPSVFVAGDKIAIVSNDNSYGLRISSNAPAATANTISDAATITPAADQVFTLAGNSTDGFTMSTASRTSEGTVTLGAASVPNSNSSENVILSSSNNTWKFSAHNTSNCILISPSSKSTCGLEYYKSSWKIYNNSGVASNAACAMRVYRKNLSGYVTTCSECMTPSDLEVSAITSTGATVTWAGVSQTQQAGGSGTGYKVAWNTSNSVPSPLNASNSADVAAGTNSYAITGLTAATQYYVFVQSKCDDSWSSSTNFYTNAKITYAAGAGSGSMDPKEVTYNTDAIVDACTFTAPSGKKFNGWVSDQSVMVSASSTTSVPEGATVTGLTKAITLTAQWRDLVSYTVNFSADNGTVAGGTAQTVYEEGKLTFPNVTSTTCGTFIGWVEAAYDNTAAPSGATFHEAGSQIDVVAELEGKTYYAVYRVATGMATTLTDNLVPSDFKATGTSYEATNNLVKTSSATYEAVTAKGNNAIQINKISDGRGIVSKISGGIFKGITLTTNANHSASREVYVYGSSSYTAAYADPAAFNTNSEVRGTLLATLAGDTKTYSTSTDDYEYIAIFADGAAYLDQISLTWYGAPMKYQTSPTCSPMVGVESNFSTFTYAYNAGPSASQSFTVSGSSLGADLVVTAPANYEVCKTADGTYTSTISYTPSDGAVANTTAYIRLAAGLNVGTYNYEAASGLQVTSTGAKTRTAALNGSVTKADCAITFTDFNAVDHYEATLEYGSRVTVSYNYTYNGDGNFSISRSPATGTIDKANKTLTVSTAGIWTLNASATAGTNYSKPSDASAQIRVKCVDTYKDFIHNKTIKAYGSGTAVTDGKMEDWGSGYTVPYIDDNAEETSGSCQQTHYKFMGWVSEDDINIADGTFKTGWTLIQAGTASKPATTKTYYAVWAKLEE